MSEIYNQNRQPSMRTPFHLANDRIVLFAFGEDELYSREYLHWMNDLQTTATLGRFDYLMPVSQEKLVEYYRSINWQNTLFLGIYLRNAGDTSTLSKEKMKFIGTLKIYDIDLLSRRASIGIAIGDREETGHGHATHAIGIACKYIFDILGFRKITAGYLSMNKGMERAFIKNGFEVEAVFKEHIHHQGHFVDHTFVCRFRS